MKQDKQLKYREEYNDQIIELGKKGFHVHEMAAHFNVHRDSIYEWSRVYPDFKKSFEIAKSMSINSHASTVRIE